MKYLPVVILIVPRGFGVRQGLFHGIRTAPFRGGDAFCVQLYQTKVLK